MSATFKNSKKKLMQSELRRLMNVHKVTKKDVKPVDSPLAKYNENGQLTCILCKSIVRSAGVWPVHINSKQHKENIEVAKKLKEKTNNFTQAIKRPSTPPIEPPAKRLKGILKKPGLNSDKDEEVHETKKGDDKNKNALPDDFFDMKGVKVPKGVAKQIGLKNDTTTSKEQVASAESASEILPEGFFDDPKLDAKARNQEYKDPIEEEWERFQKAIKEADDESAAIIAEDQDEATTERQIDEIDEQLKYLSKVLVLEQKKKEIALPVNNERMDIDGDYEIDETDFDEFLDWRSKKAFK